MLSCQSDLLTKGPGRVVSITGEPSLDQQHLNEGVEDGLEHLHQGDEVFLRYHAQLILQGTVENNIL